MQRQVATDTFQALVESGYGAMEIVEVDRGGTRGIPGHESRGGRKAKGQRGVPAHGGGQVSHNLLRLGFVLFD